MSHFLLRFRYVPSAIRSFVERPDDDRAARASALVASLGGKLLGYWYAFGEFDGMAIVEAPDSSVAAAVAMAVGGTGEVSRIETTVLMTMEEARRALHRASTATHLPPGEEGAR